MQLMQWASSCMQACCRTRAGLHKTPTASTFDQAQSSAAAQCCCRPKAAARAAGLTSIQIVDEQAAHLALPDDVGGLAVALADELGWLSGIARLELTSGHDDGGNAQLLVGKGDLEGLALALATPDTCPATSPRQTGTMPCMQTMDSPVLADMLACMLV